MYRRLLLAALFVPVAMLNFACFEPVLSVSEESHDFGPQSILWTFQVWNADTDNSLLHWTASANKPWVAILPAAGKSAGPDEKQDVLVTINRVGLSKAIVYSATITLDGGPAGIKEIPITVSKPVPKIAVSETSLNFGGKNTELTMQVWNGGDAGVKASWSASVDKDWINVTPKTGSSTSADDRDTLTVTVNRSKLTKAVNYTGNITINAGNAGTATILVTAVRLEPKLAISVTSLGFGTSATMQTFDIFNSGDTGSDLNWTASTPTPWISMNPVKGVSTGANDKDTVTVTIDRSKLAKAIEYKGKINVDAGGGGSVMIPVDATTLKASLGVISDHPANVHDFGTAGVTWQFGIWNNGDVGANMPWTVDWDREENNDGVKDSKNWITVNPTGASFASHDSENPTVITVTIDRSKMTKEGPNDGNITIDAGGAGTALIRLLADKTAGKSWAFLYPDEGTGPGEAVALNNEDTFVFAGTAGNLLIVDSDGAISPEAILDETCVSIASIADKADEQPLTRPLVDGGVITAGWTLPAKDKVFLERADVAGAILWTTCFNIGDVSRINDVQELTDGGFIVTGEGVSPEGLPCLFGARLTASGEALEAPLVAGDGAN